MMRPRREAFHRAAHTRRIRDGAEPRFPIALDPRRFDGEATEWLGSRRARSQGDGADAQKEGSRQRKEDTHVIWRPDSGGSPEDGDATPFAERHVQPATAQTSRAPRQ